MTLHQVWFIVSHVFTRGSWRFPLGCRSLRTRAFCLAVPSHRHRRRPRPLPASIRIGWRAGGHSGRGRRGWRAGKHGGSAPTINRSSYVRARVNTTYACSTLKARVMHARPQDPSCLHAIALCGPTTAPADLAARPADVRAVRGGAFRTRKRSTLPRAPRWACRQSAPTPCPLWPH